MSESNKIGVIIDAFKLGLRRGLEKAQQLGADGVQIYARGELDPDHLSPADRIELKQYIRSMGLELSALCGDLGGGFFTPETNVPKIEKSKRILDLALDLGTNIVTTHIGVIPEQPDDPAYACMQEACEELGAYAARLNAYFAIETGPESAAHLKRFLDSLSTKGVAVNYDPANLVMVAGDDPVEGVRTLKDYIVHTHVKDGSRYQHFDPRDVYGYPKHVQKERKALIPRDAYFRELPPGKGSVHFPEYFAVLREIGYKGYLTIERETGDDPVADIKETIRFIKQLAR